MQNDHRGVGRRRHGHPRDKEICARIADQLAAHGLVFVGIDVIGRYLTEINVTSPTGVREIDAFAGTRISDGVIAWVEQRAARVEVDPAVGPARTATRRAVPLTRSVRCL